MIIAQLTDLHVTEAGRAIYGALDTPALARAAVAALAAHHPAPDAVLLTGDLVHDGTAAEYAELLDILAPLRMPLYAIPGNHDSREGMRAAFAGRGYLPASGFLQYAIDDGPVRLIGLDTLVEGAVHGALCPARLDWLRATLAQAPDKPAIIFMHHPPFDTGLTMDPTRCGEGAEALGEIIAGHRNVERVLCGHLHRPVLRRWAGTVASVAPSATHQFLLNTDDRTRLTVVTEPAACQFHIWSAAGLVTHICYLGDYARVHDIIRR